MRDDAIHLGIVGFGKIARTQHLPAILSNSRVCLVGIASPEGGIDGVPSFLSLPEMLSSGLRLDAISLCTPPKSRFELAKIAAGAGHSVLLEKPPAGTVSEAVALGQLASTSGATLFSGWHSRFGAGIALLKARLAGENLRSCRVTWTEDVNRWHPGQDWIWQPSGFGVFDAGINALSILTEVITDTIGLESARLFFPDNREAPIAASLRLCTERGACIDIELDWRPRKSDVWQIEFQTERSSLLLSDGGGKLFFNGIEEPLAPLTEYAALYERFVSLICSGTSDFDISPLLLVADALMIGHREFCGRF